MDRLSRLSGPPFPCRAASLLVGAALLGSCAAFLPPPTVEIVGVEVVSLGLSSGTAAVTLDVTNESGRKMGVREVRYELEIQDTDGEEGWKSLAGGVHTEEIEVPGDQSIQVTLPVPFEYQALGAALRSFLARGEIPYRLHGDVTVRGLGLTFHVPFRNDGVLRP